MWRYWFCVLALLARPALAQTLEYDDDTGYNRDSTEQHFHSRHGHQEHSHGKHGHWGRHPGGIAPVEIDPYRAGPAPIGFWYRCDEPAGYYPYIPACRTPWRMVPSTPYR